MVHPGASGRGASFLVLLLFFVLFFPSPSSADHTQRIPVPDAGSVVGFSLSDLDVEMSFDSSAERFLGHFEERTVVLGGMTFADWNHTQGTVFDARTGLYAGTHHEFAFDFDYLPVLLDYHMSFEWTQGSSLRAHEWLPESVLWGRYIWHEETWEVPMLSVGCDTAVGGASVSPTYDEDWEIASLHAEVWRSCERDGVQYDLTWDLFWEDLSRPVADVRVFNATRSDGEAHEEVVPAHFTPGSGEVLPFGGRSESRFFGDRDHSLRYGAWEGFLPPDPEPHPVFDVHEAAIIAYGLEEEAMRLFQARATDPYLLEAEMSQTGAWVAWSLAFADDWGHEVRTSLMGVKVPGAPLLVTHSSASSYDWGWPIERSRPPYDIAYVGDGARLMDRVAAEQDTTVQRYIWGAGYGPAIFGLTFADLPDRADGRSHTVYATALNGIVAGHEVDVFRYSLDPLD